MDFLTILQILDSTVRLATPLLLACLAGLYSERGGIFDIGLEGKMLAAAFASAAVAFLTGSVWIGLLAGIGASVMLSILHGLASITFRGNQLISGVAINFLASGLTVVVGLSIFRLGGRTPALTDGARFESVSLPFSGLLGDVPLFGPIYVELLSGHTMLVYVAMLCVPLSWFVLFRTRFGLRLRAVGENPAAVDTAGISVIRLRYTAVIICGVLCGIAGAYLATGLAAGFVKEMSAGRGFIALAALIFAKWRPVQALGATLLFGLLEAISNRYPNIDIPASMLIIILVLLAAGLLYAGRKSRLDLAVLGGLSALLIGAAVSVFVSSGLSGTATLPSQFMQALPYILTVVILAGFVGKAVPPRAGGQPYVKER
ncbi:ABC transporter permease [uncultured Litoreibacter sp.]|uniref:ABC transporter permease n=1 Tax=uncultured Litoreibacter sp. TaxID=1392394 RepID=UPI00262E8BB9|nr:ABC transporter permease [uncultured Litoreibacter sp.]